MTARLFLVSLALILTACQNPIKKAVRDVKYSAYEMVGVEKRDLFKRRVNAVKDSQEDAGESYKDALTRLKEVYKFDGGKLEQEYESLNSSYETAKSRSATVSENVKQIETISGDLFAEWKKEIGEISSADLRAKSNKQLEETKAKYRAYHSELKKSETKMAPVLTKLKDHVLYLKHNLNAKAIAGLKSESLKIQNDIESLIKDMNASISRSENFLKELE